MSLHTSILSAIGPKTSWTTYTARGSDCPIVERNSFRFPRGKRNEFRSTTPGGVATVDACESPLYNIPEA